MKIVLEIQKIHYSKLKPHPLLPFLWIGSAFYSMAINIKNLLYEISILKETKVGAKVICVGNLTTGGVGKTPVVCEIANYLAKKGRRPAVLSRGYGGNLDNKNVNIVKNFDDILIKEAKMCGDEPLLIAQNTTNAAVLTCKNRVKSAKYAIEKLNADILIMDDGFSNRKIFKDLNIMLFDSKKFIGNGNLLPLGPLREPLSAVKRADKILLINKGEINIEKVKAQIESKFKKTPIICSMQKDIVFNPKNGDTVEAQGQKVFAFCAIAQPEQFYNYLIKDFNLVGEKTFKDHHPYSKKDIEEIVTLAKKMGAEKIITTEKDFVKIKNFTNNDIYVLKLKQLLNFEELLN